MSAYPSPTNIESLSVFNNANFIGTSDNLTIDYANAHYLKYPVAQGNENLQNIVVGGSGTFNSDMSCAGTATFSGSLVSPSGASGYASFHKMRLTGYQEFTGTTGTLTLAMSGHKVYCSNVGTTTITLPDISNVSTNGACYFITAKANLTINAQTGQTIYPNATTSISLTANQTVDIGCNGGFWYIFGGNFNSTGGGGGGDVYLANSQTFTGVNTFTNTTVQKNSKLAVQNSSATEIGGFYGNTSDNQPNLTCSSLTLAKATISATGTTTLTVNDSGKLITCGAMASGTTTFNLPTIANATTTGNASGIFYTFFHSGTGGTFTISTTDGALIQPNNVSSISFFKKNSAILRCDGVSWFVVGGTANVVGSGLDANVYTINSNYVSNVGGFVFRDLYNLSSNLSLSDTYSNCWLYVNATGLTMTLPVLDGNNRRGMCYKIYANGFNTTIITQSSQLIYPIVGSSTVSSISLLSGQSILIENQVIGGTYSWKITGGSYQYYNSTLSILDNTSTEVNSMLATSTAIKANVNCSSITLAKSFVNIGTSGGTYSLTMADSGKILTCTGLGANTCTYILPKMADITATGNYSAGLIYYFVNTAVINSSLLINLQAGETAKIYPNGTTAPNSLYILSGCCCQIRTDGTNWYCVGGNNNSLPMLGSSSMGVNNSTTNVGETFYLSAGTKIQLSPSLGNAYTQLDNALIYPYQLLLSTASATTTLTEVHSGKWIVISASGNTLTLPTLSSTTKGYKYQFYTSAGNSAVINTAVGQPIYYDDNSTSGSFNNITSLTLPAYTSLILECQELTAGNYSWRYVGGYRMSSATTDITGGLTTGYMLSYGASYGQGTAMSNRWIATNVSASGQYFTLTNLTSTNRIGLKHKFYNNSAYVVEIRSAGTSNKLYYQNNEITTTSAGVPVIYLQPYTGIELENQELSSGVFSYRITGGDWYVGQTNITITNKYTTTSRGINNVIIGVDAMGNAGSTSTSNVAIGYQALNTATANIVDSIAIGARSLAKYNSTGNNTSIGRMTFENLLSGSGNTAIGLRCGQSLSSGDNNSFFGGDNAIALKTTCNKNILFGNQCMSGAIGQNMSYAQPPSAVSNATSFVIAYNPINITNAPASLFIAGMKMTCWASGVGSFTVIVNSYTPSTKTVVVSSAVYIDALQFVYFYYQGNISAQNNIITGGTSTTTITIQTGYTISANFILGYLDSATSQYKYATVSAYNSGTGVLTLSSAITTASTTGFIVWSNVQTTGTNVVDNCGMGLFSLGNISGASVRNTSIGNYALNGSGEIGFGYNNNQYLYGYDNTALGYGAGGTLTGIGYANTFVGSGADISTRGLLVSNSTALGFNAKVDRPNQIMLGTSTETVYFPNQINIRSVFSPYSINTSGLTPSTNTIPAPSTTPIAGTYLTNETSAYTIILPVITADMLGITILFRKNSNYSNIVSVQSSGTDTILSIVNTTPISAGTSTPFITTSFVVGRLAVIASNQWAIMVN